MRALVGPTEEAAFDNPTGDPVICELPDSAWDFVLDFGCGCGRLARQMLQQSPRPRRYLGVDLHAGMIRWCQRNLAPRSADFEFLHQDIFNAGFNPTGRLQSARFPVPDGSVSLVIAWSVFTHLLEDAAGFYLEEVGRVLRPDGLAVASFFLFDKVDFPMMQSFQNALYINPVDPSNAVIFDREWWRAGLAAAGLVPVRIEAPEIRGYQWLARLAPATSGVAAAEFPTDQGRPGRIAPPTTPPGAARLGLDD